MRKRTSLVLIRTDTKDVYVNQYNVRKTLGGQLVLELEERKGSIYQLNLDTEEAFVAIMINDYYSRKRKVKAIIGGALQEIAQEISVVATLNDEDFEKYVPYRIVFFCNNMLLERVNSTKSVDILENEILIEVDKGKKTIFSIRKTNTSSYINLEKIRPEENPLYANIQNVEWVDKNRYNKNDTYIFDREWANSMLRKLLKIKNNDTIIYPTLKGKWVKEKNSAKKVLPEAAYKKFLKGRQTTKDFWREYLQNILKIEVEYPEESAEGIIIKQQYKKGVK